MGVDRELFRPLEPPPGGAERFRQRLETEQRPEAVWRWRPVLVTTAVFVLLGTVLVALLDSRTEQDSDHPSEPLAALQDAPELDRLLGRPLEKSEPTVTVNERTAALAALRSENEKVRIYRID